MPAVTKIVKSGVSQDEIDRIIKFKKEVHSIVPFELKEGDRITADMLANKLNEIISVINALEEVRVSSKDW